MRKIYIMTMAAMVAVGAVAAPRIVTKHHGAGRAGKAVTERAGKKKACLRGQRVAGAEIWRAGKQVQFDWDGDAWVPAVEYNDTYLENGLMSETLVRDLSDEEGLQQHFTYGYDDAGYRTSELLEVSQNGGGSFMNWQRTEQEYDPVVKSLVVSHLQYLSGYAMGQEDGEWYQNGNNYLRKVTRNADGNVTGVVVETLYDGEFTPVQRMTVTYGADKKATAILVEVLSYSDGDEEVWEPDADYRDIVWERTDGQIVNEDLTYDNNRISSCKYYDEDGENLITVTYGENGSFKSVLSYEYGTLTAEYDAVDANGSNDYMAMEVYDDGENRYAAKELSRERFTADGLQTELYQAVGEVEGSTELTDEDMLVESWVKGDVETDSQGRPTVYTLTEYDLDSETFGNVMKVEFSDYKDVSGVAGVSDESAPAEYYNLQGVRVAGPQPGMLLIRRQGSESRKVQY